MPHDKNGNVIESGDGVVFADWAGVNRVGVVTHVVAQTTNCNVIVTTPVIGGCQAQTVNADMCEVLTRDGARVPLPPPAAATPTDDAEPGRLAGG